MLYQIDENYGEQAEKKAIIILQQHFNYSPLQKIDPNTQEVTDNDTTTAGEFGQAAIPVILAGLYKFTRSDEGADTVISGENSPSWVKTIFADQHQQIIKRVADYAATDYDTTENKLNAIAVKAVELIKEAAGPDPKNIVVKELMVAFLMHITIVTIMIAKTSGVDEVPLLVRLFVDVRFMCYVFMFEIVLMRE